MLAQQGKRMPAEVQAEAGVIGDDVLPLARRRKRRYFLFLLENVQGRKPLGSRGGPAGKPAMAGQRREGPRRRQAAQLFAVEVRPVCEVRCWKIIFVRSDA